MLFRTLDEKGRSIYKENVDLIKSRHIYQQELEDLQQLKEQLAKQATVVIGDKDVNDVLMKEKIEQVQQQNKLIKEVRKQIELKTIIFFIFS